MYRDTAEWGSLIRLPQTALMTWIVSWRKLILATVVLYGLHKPEVHKRSASLSNFTIWDAGRPNGSGQCAVNINNVWQDYNCTLLYFVRYYGKPANHICTNVPFNRTMWCYPFILNVMLQREKDTSWYNLTKPGKILSNYTDLATICSLWEQKQLMELVEIGPTPGSDLISGGSFSEIGL